LLRLTTDGHKASRGLSAIAELLVVALAVVECDIAIGDVFVHPKKLIRDLIRQTTIRQYE